MESVNREAGTLYRAVWRWHFYAGLLVLPFMMWLAVTGALYLYKPEVEGLVYARWMHVRPQAERLPLAVLADRVGRTTGGQVLQITSTAGADESWRATFIRGGEKRTAFVDPYSAGVLGTTTQGGLMQTVKSLHSLAITGPIGNAVIEIVAGWAIVLVLTGAYLWWPRGAHPALGLRGAPSGRLFWRDLHASTGLIAGAVVFFLALSGMPWTGVWGHWLQTIVASRGLGRPEAPSRPDGMRHAPHDEHDAAMSLPWSMQGAAPPSGGAGRDVGPDRALRAAEQRGLSAPWTMTFPSKPRAPYLLSATIRKAEDARAIYVDAQSGRVLQDARYAGFGTGAQTIEWGIAVHQGQEYGEPNRLAMLAGCLAVVLLSLSAPVMWWKRRARGTVGAPPRSPQRSSGLMAIMLATGAVFPLTGLTMALALAADVVVRRAAGALFPPNSTGPAI